MEVAEEAPLNINNLKSARSNEPIVALGIEGSANKVGSGYEYHSLSIDQ